MLQTKNKHPTTTKEKPQITIDDLATHREKSFMKKLLVIVIVVNIIVLISIALCT